MIYGFNVFICRLVCCIKLEVILIVYQSFQVNSGIKKVSTSIVLATISYAYYRTTQ